MLAAAVLGSLVAGIEFDDPPGEVALPARAAAEEASSPSARPSPETAPTLAPCDPGPTDELCERWSLPHRQGRFVLADGRRLILSEPRGSVAALDRDSGTVLWQAPATVGELVAGGTGPSSLIVVGAGGALHDDRLAGFDQDGTLRWTAPAAGEPLVVETGAGLLVVEAAALRHLDAATGEENWGWTTTDPAGLWLVDTDGDRPVVASGGALTALDPRTGTPRWTVAVPGLRGATVSGTDRLVAVDGDGRMLGISAGSGTVRWDARLAFGDRSAVRVHGADDLVIVAIDPPLADDGTRTSRLVGVDPSSGAVRWVHLYRSRTDRRALAISPAGVTLVGTSSPGTVAVLDPATGGITWQRDLGPDPAHARAVGAHIVAASGRTVSLLTAEEGREIGTGSIDTPIIRIVAADAGTVVLRTTTRIVVLGLPTDPPTGG